METVASFVQFEVQLSKLEIEAIKRLLSGNKLEFEVAKEAILQIRVLVKVERGFKED